MTRPGKSKAKAKSWIDDDDEEEEEEEEMTEEDSAEEEEAIRWVVAATNFELLAHIFSHQTSQNLKHCLSDK